ncbi:MAG: hydantoinase/oxoprolinase family protein [Acidobacteriia bacterium]|nr:hydantoinase/oxoprolinase family protein [Terriglobia bacterium]
MLKIGIDTGGTFTDFIVLDGKRVRTLKLLSTPSNPALAIFQGLQELLDNRECDIRHGSTVATNALLERKGAVTALITTAGFEDVLEIGRQNRPKIYSLYPSRPDPLVPGRRRFGVMERILHDASVLVPLHPGELRSLVDKLRRAKVQSVAVCLLFSFANSAHEKQIGNALRNLKIPISLSHIILPEYREYERTSTTVVNAYLAPVMGRYLGDLEERLRARRRRKTASLRIMQSNGGTVSARGAIREPVRTILSGPAGGVVGAWEVARQAGFPDILSFDMGGTSTDVSLCEGEIRITSESVIANCPIGVPVIDIHTVGAGGGSIARVDEGGALRVGPESAGADPGPICYGKGERITVTDANLYLGKLDTGYPLGGRLHIDDQRIEPAFRALARKMGAASPAAAAQGVVDVANANMEAALRVISVERGYDPRDFTLVTFGGAGGLHAVQLAASLSIPRVLIPENPGLLSALGVLLSDSVQDFSRTVMLASEEAGIAALEERYRELERKALASMMAEGFPAQRIRLERWIDMRYHGQSYELSFPYSRRFAGEFHRRHEQRYGYADPSRESEIVTMRVRVRGLSDKPRMPKDRRGPPDPKRALIKEKDVRFEGKSKRTRIYERALLRAGHRITGPALIFEYSATAAIPPGYLCIVDAYRNLILSHE